MNINKKEFLVNPWPLVAAISALTLTTGLFALSIGGLIHMPMNYVEFGVEMLDLCRYLATLSISRETYVVLVFFILPIFIEFLKIQNLTINLVLFAIVFNVLKVLILGKILLVGLVLQLFFILIFPILLLWLKLLYTSKDSNNDKSDKDFNENNNNNDKSDKDFNRDNNSDNRSPFIKKIENFIMFTNLVIIYVFRYIFNRIVLITNIFIQERAETKSNPIISTILLIFGSWYKLIKSSLSVLENNEINIKLFFLSMSMFLYHYYIPKILIHDFNYDPNQAYVYAALYLLIFMFYPLRFYPLLASAADDHVFKQNDLMYLSLSQLFFIIKDASNLVLSKPLVYKIHRTIFTSAIVKFISSGGVKALIVICGSATTGILGTAAADSFGHYQRAKVEMYVHDNITKADMHRQDQKTERARLALEALKEKNKSLPPKSGWFK